MNLIRKTLDKTRNILEGRPGWMLYKTALDALDSFFFGSSDVSSGAPFVRDYINLKRYMITVIVALFPVVLSAIYRFGWRVVVVILVSYIFGVSTEWIFCTIRKEELTEGAFVTCMIYPLTLPPKVPLWIVAIGITFGTIFGKEVFGGTGKNLFNPALVGRLFISIAFTSIMTSNWYEPYEGIIGGFSKYSVDALTTATPLSRFKTSGEIVPYASLLKGDIPGCIGETSKIVILLCGTFLMITKVSNWRIPLTYLGSATIFCAIFSQIFPEKFAPPIFHLLSGGLLFGAMFMATDPVTSPMTMAGKWIYGSLLGVLTIIIRGLSGYMEGITFAIVLMNIFAPLIDNAVLALKSKQKIT